MTTRSAAFLVAGALIAPFAHGEATRQGPDTVLVQATAALSDGEIRKVDKDGKKITIRHGPLANLDMPAMTMVFQVKDPALLEQVKAGDQVKFVAEKVGGAFRVTQIQPAM